MIDKLIEKYKRRVEHYKNTVLDTDNSIDRYVETEKLNIHQEILKDLEELKEKIRKELYGQDMTIAEYKGTCRRLGVDIDE